MIPGRLYSTQAPPARLTAGSHGEAADGAGTAGTTPRRAAARRGRGGSRRPTRPAHPERHAARGARFRERAGAERARSWPRSARRGASRAGRGRHRQGRVRGAAAPRELGGLATPTSASGFAVTAAIGRLGTPRHTGRARPPQRGLAAASRGPGAGSGCPLGCSPRLHPHDPVAVCVSDIDPAGPTPRHALRAEELPVASAEAAPGQPRRAPRLLPRPIDRRRWAHDALTLLALAGTALLALGARYP
jgi:hypothetical protein